MGIINKIGGTLNDIINVPGRLISAEISRQVVEKSRVATRAALVELDGVAPVLTDVISGRKVVIHTKTEVWIEENLEDTK